MSGTPTRRDDPIRYEGKCEYCGEKSNTLDHFIPKKLVGNNTEIYPCCFECNNTLNDFIFGDVQEARNYLLERYMGKYGKLLKVTEWTAEELMELDDDLRYKVLTIQAEREKLMRRLSFLDEGNR